MRSRSTEPIGAPPRRNGLEPQPTHDGPGEPLLADRALAGARAGTAAAHAADPADANANANANAAAGSDLPPLDRFFRHTLLPELRDGDGVWQGSPKLWRDVEGCDSPSLFSFDDAIAASLGGLLDRACVAKAEEALEGNWVSEYAPSKTADDLRRFLDRGTLFFNGAGLDFPHLADLAASCQAARPRRSAVHQGVSACHGCRR